MKKGEADIHYTQLAITPQPWPPWIPTPAKLLPFLPLSLTAQILLLVWLWGGKNAGEGRYLVRFAPDPASPHCQSKLGCITSLDRAMATPPRKKECDPWSLVLENRESFKFCHKSAVTSAVHLISELYSQANGDVNICSDFLMLLIWGSN